MEMGEGEGGKERGAESSPNATENEKRLFQIALN